ncbi:MAG: hypothetical protein R2874_06725 [Desulfobacterales bacterium]
MWACGKQPDVAALQDLPLYAVKGLSQMAVEGRKVGIRIRALTGSPVKRFFLNPYQCRF